MSADGSIGASAAQASAYDTLAPAALNPATLNPAALAGDLLAMAGFLLLLLAAFALALAHGAHARRRISLFLNGSALALGCVLLLTKFNLLAVADERLPLLRGATGLCAALAVLALWPSLKRLLKQNAESEQAATLPLLATPGGPLSLEDALGASGAVVFARTAKNTGEHTGESRECFRVPRPAEHNAALENWLNETTQQALGQPHPLTRSLQTTSAADAPQWYELTVKSGRLRNGEDGAIGCLLDVTRFRKAEADCRHMLQEATHRAKNLLTIIQSVTRMSAKTLGLPASAVEPFTARLQAIAMCYDLLVREEWEAVPLTDLLHSQLNHTLGNAAARASWSGPTLRLRPTAVQTLALAIHELAARAMLQGAMTNPAGRLRITWEETRMRDGNPGYRLIWQEIGHGPESPPDQRSFARDILERLTPRGLRGDVNASNTEDGFRWEVRFPATNTLPPREG